MPELKPKRKMDWAGLIVRSNTDFVNGYGAMPSGTLFVVNDYHRGLSVTGVPCELCGGKPHYTCVDMEDVDIVEMDYNYLRIAWNEKRKYVKGFYGRQLQVDDPERGKKLDEALAEWKNQKAKNRNSLEAIGEDLFFLKEMRDHLENNNRENVVQMISDWISELTEQEKAKSIGEPKMTDKFNELIKNLLST